MLHYKIHKSKQNNAPWITFIHGAGGSSAIWFRQIRFFSKDFNLLLVDLRGHGKSKAPKQGSRKNYTFAAIADEIFEVLTHLKIKASHFAGISLGTLLIREIAEKKPEMVRSVILGGAVLDLNFKSRMLMRLGNSLKSILPYMWIYKVFAFIILPKRNHKESRLIFVREAKKLYQKEFVRWFKLTTEIMPKLKIFRQLPLQAPTLYIMGEEDYMFLPAVTQVAKKHQSAGLFVIPKCGHLVNIEQPEVFNKTMFQFLRKPTA
jgi:pimeloyl-ACP methyl ester carboxylesterase